VGALVRPAVRALVGTAIGALVGAGGVRALGCGIRSLVLHIGALGAATAAGRALRRLGGLGFIDGRRRLRGGLPLVGGLARCARGALAGRLGRRFVSIGRARL